MIGSAGLLQVIVDLIQERDFLASQQSQEGPRNARGGGPQPGRACGPAEMSSSSSGAAAATAGLTQVEKQHLSVELADTKAKLRRYRQEV